MINLDEFDVYVWIKDIAGRYTIKKKKSSLEESFVKLNQRQPALQPTPGASSQNLDELTNCLYKAIQMGEVKEGLLFGLIKIVTGKML